nr:MAG TPA: hypothetical protein [Caudoviricetes sp.]
MTILQPRSLYQIYISSLCSDGVLENIFKYTLAPCSRLVCLKINNFKTYISSPCSLYISEFYSDIHYTSWMHGIFTRDSCIQC